MNRLIEIDTEIRRARARVKAAAPRPVAMARALSASPPSLVRTRAVAFDLGEPVRWTTRALGTPMPAIPGPDALVGYARVGAVSPYLAVRRSPDPAATELEQLKFNDRVLVLAKISAPKDWALVVTDRGNIGYVSALFLFYNPPEPDAILYKLQKGDAAYDVAKKFYGHGVGWGHDLRFYVNVLVYANRGEGDQRKGIHKDNKDDSWRATETKAGFYIWVPTLAFADSLRGVVKSESITYELWQQIAGVWDWVKFGLAFVGGLLHGALACVWDALTGIADLLELAWDLIKSIFTGEIISDAKNLYKALEKLTWADVEDVIKEWFAGVKAKWTHANPWKRGHFQGYVVGYIVAEVLIAVFTAGSVTAAKWGGRVGKAIKFLKTLKLGKAIDKADDLRKKAKGKVDDVRKALAKRRARKAVDSVVDKRTADKLVREIGEEAAAKLVESLGKTLSRELAGELDAKVLQALAKKPGKDVLEQLGPAAIKRQLKSGMTADELADWTADVGAKVLKKYAEKFDWDVIKHYGKKFWKKWQGITADTMDHLLKARLKTRPNGDRYISGGHEPKELKRVVEGHRRGAWRPTSQHGSMPGAEIASFDLNGNGHLARKTVMPDLDTNPGKWTTSCEEAIDEALRAKRIPNTLTAAQASAPGDIRWHGFDKAGRLWRGFLKNPRSTAEPIGELVTFYPG